MLIAPDLKANVNNLGMPFRSSVELWYVECTHSGDSNEYTQHTFS